MLSRKRRHSFLIYRFGKKRNAAGKRYTVSNWRSFVFRRNKESKGVTLAIETGPEKAKTLLAFLQDTKGGVDALNACEGFKEVPLGEGEVDWVNYLKALKEIGFDGFLTIERECGDNPQADIEKAFSFLKTRI